MQTLQIPTPEHVAFLAGTPAETIARWAQPTPATGIWFVAPDSYEYPSREMADARAAELRSLYEGDFTVTEGRAPWWNPEWIIGLPTRQARVPMWHIGSRVFTVYRDAERRSAECRSYGYDHDHKIKAGAPAYDKGGSRNFPIPVNVEGGIRLSDVGSDHDLGLTDVPRPSGAPYGEIPLYPHGCMPGHEQKIILDLPRLPWAEVVAAHQREDGFGNWWTIRIPLELAQKLAPAIRRAQMPEWLKGWEGGATRPRGGRYDPADPCLDAEEARRWYRCSGRTGAAPMHNPPSLEGWDFAEGYSVCDSFRQGWTDVVYCPIAIHRETGIFRVLPKNFRDPESRPAWVAELETAAADAAVNIRL